MRQLTKAIVAASLGIVLLSSAGVTLAKWTDSRSLSDADITSGHLRITAGKTSPIVLNSRLDSTARDFAPSTPCQSPDGYEACREFSAQQLSSARIVPGDQLIIREEFSVDAVGTNLQAQVSANNVAVSQVFPPGTKTQTTILRDGKPVNNPAVVANNSSGSVWEVRATITTPDAWPTSFEKSTLSISSVHVTLEQIKP